MIGITEYYERPPQDYREVLSPGLICRTPIHFVVRDKPDRIALNWLNPKNPADSEYKFVETDLSSYDPTTDKPMRHINLPSDTFLLAIGQKYRNCILISDPIPNPDLRKPVGDSGFMVVPLYGLFDAAGNLKSYIDDEIILRAQAYQYHNIFYLPESAEHGLAQSFARVDRMQFIKIDHLQPRPIILTSEALDLLRQWAWYCLGSPLFDAALEEYIEAAAVELRDKFGE